MEKNFILFGHLEFYSNAKLTLGILMKAKIGSGQCFSNFNVHTNYPEFLVKMQILIQWFWAGAENLHS